MAKLTAVQVRKASPKNKPYKLPDGMGLYLHVSTSRKRTWRYRFKLNKKNQRWWVKPVDKPISIPR
ncbi:MAG: DUF4102 domain-containing protein [Candidatus Electrothrix sp. EH2]|nr:DUF4102 domain-containing protein [Candidatus Electrothrix sp. EH2]